TGSTAHRSCRPRPRARFVIRASFSNSLDSPLSHFKTTPITNTKVSIRDTLVEIYSLYIEQVVQRSYLMDIYEALYTTRAMRRMKPDPIPYDVQARILDAAIRAPHIGEGWRFILVDDPNIKSQLAPLYRQGFERMIGGAPEELFAEVIKADTQMGRTVRSGLYLVNHFA